MSRAESLSGPRWRRHREVLPVIALGGMVGASARYAIALGWPTAPDAVPWGTLVVNASGCLLIGMVMVFVVEVGGAHPLVRPFVGVGVLGGFTTFSTYAVESNDLLVAGDPRLGLGYLFGTVLLALVAVTSGLVLARLGVRIRRARRRSTQGRAAQDREGRGGRG